MYVCMFIYIVRRGFFFVIYPALNAEETGRIWRRIL